MHNPSSTCVSLCHIVSITGLRRLSSARRSIQSRSLSGLEGLMFHGLCGLWKEKKLIQLCSGSYLDRLDQFLPTYWRSVIVDETKPPWCFEMFFVQCMLLHVASIPRWSMYGISTYIWVIYGVNVATYSIHGSSGIYNESMHCSPPVVGIWPLCAPKQDP